MLKTIFIVYFAISVISTKNITKEVIHNEILQKSVESYARWVPPSEINESVKIETPAEAYSKDTSLLTFNLINRGTVEFICDYQDILFLKQVGNEWFIVPDMEVLFASSGKLVLEEGVNFYQSFDIAVENEYVLDIGQYGIAIKYNDNAGSIYQNFVSFPVVEKGDIRTYEIWKPESPTVENIRLELESNEYAVYPYEIRGTLINEEGRRDRIFGENWFLLKKMDGQWRIIPWTFEGGWFASVARVLGERHERIFELRDNFGDKFDYDFSPGEYAVAFYISGNTPEQVTVFSEFSMY